MNTSRYACVLLAHISVCMMFLVFQIFFFFFPSYFIIRCFACIFQFVYFPSLGLGCLSRGAQGDSNVASSCLGANDFSQCIIDQFTIQKRCRNRLVWESCNRSIIYVYIQKTRTRQETSMCLPLNCPFPFFPLSFIYSLTSCTRKVFSFYITQNHHPSSRQSISLSQHNNCKTTSEKKKEGTYGANSPNLCPTISSVINTST